MGKKVGGRDFQKGNPGGPGRPPLLPQVEGLPRLSKDSYNRLLNQMLHLTKDQLQALVNDPAKPMIEKWLASIVVKGTVLGDTGRMESLLNRAIGPVPKELSGIDGQEIGIKVIVEDFTK